MPRVISWVSKQITNVHHAFQRRRKNTGLSLERRLRRVRMHLKKSTSAMTTSSTRILRPEEYGGVFKKGERVLELHFYSTSLPTMKNAIREAEMQFEFWKASGVAGVYGDTPTRAVVALWRQLGAKIITCPPVDARIAHQHYLEGIKYFGFPPENAKEPVQRIVLRFPK